MKKLLLTVIVLSFCSFLFAQDVIVKRDGTKIDAIVQTVGEKEISYKKVDNQEGPTYTISVSEVLTIIYKNGSVDTFGANQTSTSSTQSTPTSTSTSTYSSSSTTYIPPYSTYRTDAMRDFCPQCYDYLGTARGLNVAGSVLLPFGVVGVTLGIIGYAVNINTMGYVGLVVGVPCLAASIPLLCVGSYKYRKAKEAYDNCVRMYNTSNDFNGFRLDLQGSQDGVGLALKF